MEEIHSDINLAKQQISGLIDSFHEAGKFLAEMCKKHENFLTILHAEFKNSISLAYLRRLVKCGNGELHEKLVFVVGSAQPWLEKLSYQDQCKIINGVRWPLDNGDHRVMPIEELRYHEGSALCFGGVLADDETIIRRIKVHNERQILKLKSSSDRYQEYQNEQDQDMVTIESMGIKRIGDNVFFPKGTKVHLKCIATYLLKNGY